MRMSLHIGTGRSDRFGASATPREMPRLQLFAAGAVLRRTARHVPRGEDVGDTSIRNPKIGCTSCGTAIDSGRPGSIRKNIIGHRMTVRRKYFFGWSGFQRPGRPFALLNQQARKHGTGVFFDPLVKQRANFLAEIGGVAETREFVALQRISRSREKKLPRGLRLGTGHLRLLKRDAGKITGQ